MNDETVAEILRIVQGIDRKVDVVQTDLVDHMGKEELVIAGIKWNIDSLTGAFPNDDYVGHRLYHASAIERNRWIIQLCKDVTREVAKYGLIGFLLWLGYHAWIGFLAGPK